MKTLLALALLAATARAEMLPNNNPLIVSLWHTWVNPAGVTVFWDSSTAPVLADSPEFLHTRATAPTGAAYEIDITASTMSLKASDLSNVKMNIVPDGVADRYYLFIDATAQITSAALRTAAPAGVTMQIIPKGTDLVVQDKSYPLDLDLELEQDAILIELGPGTVLNDDALEIIVDYVRVAAEPTADAAQLFTEEDPTEDVSAASKNAVVAASLLVVSCAALFL